MTDDADQGLLASETIDERRARLVVPPPTRRPWRRAGVLLVIAALAAGVWFGVVPGSSALGRYPAWTLHELAGRIDEANRASGLWCGSPPPVHVNLLTGRVEVRHSVIALTAEERAMIDGPAYAAVSTGPEGSPMAGC